jgi:hypothetical protein
MKPMVAAVTIVLAAVVRPVVCQQQDLTEEIKRLRRELMQVQEKRNRTQEEIAKDKEDFQSYRKRSLERMRDIRQETDSIRQVIQQYSQQRDSLEAVVGGVKSRTRHYELLQDAFRRELVGACDTVGLYASELPPAGAEKVLSAIGLLRNELTTKTVDNIKSVTRLFQIVRDMHELEASIQIVQGTSPVPDIRGTTYRLRLGAFFEAVVNTAGTRAALWTGYDDEGNPQWRSIDDVAVASQVLKAVNVREGKSLPALVELPLSDVTVAEGE